jgi:hypothetical protein
VIVDRIPGKAEPQHRSSRYLVGALDLRHEEAVGVGGGALGGRRGARAEELVGGVERDEDHGGGAGDLDLPAGREEEPKRRRGRRWRRTCSRSGRHAGCDEAD